MQELKGNIFNFEGFICIPTNKGFTKSKINVMGAGLAYQVKLKYPFIAEWYGKVLNKRLLNNDNRNIVVEVRNKLIMFPTKKLDVVNPHLSWKQKSDLETIEKSLSELREIVLSGKIKDSIYIPLVGCGNGKLKESDVLPLMKKYLDDLKNIYLVRV